MNGAVGLAIVPQGQIMGALGFTCSDGKITEIDMISEPGLTLTLYAAEPASPTAHALALLASWASSQRTSIDSPAGSTD